VEERDRETHRLKEDFLVIKAGLEEKVTELADKVTFFRQNQKLLTEDDHERREASQEVLALKERARKLEEEARRAKDLEKKCKLLEETIKARNPNSIPMLMQQVKDSTSQDQAEVAELRSRVKRLEVELDEKDKDYDKKLRTLR
jgi:seryl-tRNA synthetase